MKKYIKEKGHRYYLFFPAFKTKPTKYQLKYLGQTSDSKIILQLYKSDLKECFSYSAWDPFFVSVLKSDW